MSTRSFSYITRPLLVGALCAVLANGVLAGVKDARKPDADAAKSASEKRSADTRGHQEDRRDSTADKAAMEQAAAAKQKTGNEDHHAVRGDYGDKNSKPGTDYRRPDNDYRPSQRPNQGYRQPSETRGKHDEDYRRPDRSPAYSPDSPSSAKRSRDQVIYRQRVYIPPTYRGGYYYYSSRPSSKPCHYGHWVFDDCGSAVCRRSVYFHYGYFPYVSVLKVHTAPYVSASYYRKPVIIGGGGYYLSDRTDADLDNALADIRSAWLDGRFDLIEKRVSTVQSIAVLLDGRYDYSLYADDYTQMTFDAIDQIETTGFTWESIRQRTDGAYTAFGKHNYYDESRTRKTVYVSYTLRKIGAKYVITEVGSSTSPLI